MRRSLASLFTNAAMLSLVFGVVSCSQTTQAPQSALVTTPSGLQYEDTFIGTGAVPDSGQTLVTNYTGRLARPDSMLFDSNVLPQFQHMQPFVFRFKVGQVIKGFDEGFATMHVGGKRRLIIPPSLGYGSRDLGTIPANSTLIFDVELLAIQ